MIIYDNYKVSNEYLNNNLKNIRDIKVEWGVLIIVFKDGSSFGLYSDSWDMYLKEVEK